MNAILYLDCTGGQWAYLPHDFPPHQSVYGYFARWQKGGVFAQLNGLIRELVRQQEGKAPEPTACVIDAQSVKTFTSVPAKNQDIDAGNKIIGRKRSIATDTLGLLLAVLVTAVGVQDSTAGRTLLDQAAADHPGLRKVWVGDGYRKHLVEHALPSAPTWKLPHASPGPEVSRRSRSGGRSSGTMAGSCCTAA